MATHDSETEFAAAPASGEPPTERENHVADCAEHAADRADHATDGATSHHPATIAPPRPPPLPSRRPDAGAPPDPPAADVAEPPRLFAARPRCDDPTPPAIVMPRNGDNAPADDAFDDIAIDDDAPDDETFEHEAAEDESDEQEADAEQVARQGLRVSGAALSSMVFHLVLLLVLACFLMPQVLENTPPAILVNLSPAAEEELVTFELEAEAHSSLTFAAAGGLSTVGAPGASTGLISRLDLDGKVVEQAGEVAEVRVESPLMGIPHQQQLIRETPDGALGDPRAIVDNYDEALDRITQEILWMLSRSPVLLVWCFDQSESMKDDQQEIRARIRRVYSELGLLGQTSNDALTNAVTSFGQGFATHTRRPTADVDQIMAAIEAVPIDPSGAEMMCPAVTSAIGQHMEYAKKGGRQMALVLVTDESGDREANVQYLEQAVAAAKAAHCRVYILGREAVFGYPYAHMRWKQPFSGHVHWIPIDRGPETSFVEQLQTDGFRRRYDAHSSGFGPYEQTRLARETGGIFFMLPSLETRLVRGEKRRYELEAMRAYRPDLRARGAVLQDRDNSVLRSVLCKIINDLNPYEKDVAAVMEVAYTFSAKPEPFAQQVRAQQAKARVYLTYLDQAARALEEIRAPRNQEIAPRWQANYDLVYAQVLAYTARTYEYGAYLERFITDPKIVPLEKPNLLRLSSWHIEHSPQTVGGELTDSYIQRSKTMFHQILYDHAGTPWAARAQWELDRGFGFVLREHYTYYGPRPPRPPSGPTLPVPKL